MRGEKAAVLVAHGRLRGIAGAGDLLPARGGERRLRTRPSLFPVAAPGDVEHQRCAAAGRPDVDGVRKDNVPGWECERGVLLGLRSRQKAPLPGRTEHQFRATGGRLDVGHELGMAGTEVVRGGGRSGAGAGGYLKAEGRGPVVSILFKKKREKVASENEVFRSFSEG